MTAHDDRRGRPTVRGLHRQEDAEVTAVVAGSAALAVAEHAERAGQVAVDQAARLRDATRAVIGRAAAAGPRQITAALLRIGAALALAMVVVRARRRRTGA